MRTENWKYRLEIPFDWLGFQFDCPSKCSSSFASRGRTISVLVAFYWVIDWQSRLLVSSTSENVMLIWCANNNWICGSLSFDLLDLLDLLCLLVENRTNILVTYWWIECNRWTKEKQPMPATQLKRNTFKHIQAIEWKSNGIKPMWRLKTFNVN